MDAPSGTIIAYATAPGSVASDGPRQNGLYTQSLIENMDVPGLKIEDVFKKVRSSVREQSYGKQTPWESSSLEGDFYFKFSSEQEKQFNVIKALSILEQEKLIIESEKERLRQDKTKLKQQITNFREEANQRINNLEKNTVNVRMRNHSSYAFEVTSGEFKGVFLRPGETSSFAKRIGIGQYTFNVKFKSGGRYKEWPVSRNITHSADFITLKDVRR